MAPLDAKARQTGRAAMEGRMTAAKRVRRRLRSGKPAALPAEPPSLMHALYRAMTEADRAQNIMREEGIEPSEKTFSLSLAYMRVKGGTFEFKPIPEPGRLAPFFAALEEHDDTIFPGLLWSLRDAEASTTLVWITAFSTNPSANAHLAAAASVVVHNAPQTGAPTKSKDE